MPSDSAEHFHLYLVRHAHAGWAAPNVSDFDRPLDDAGRHEARDVAEQALMAGLRPAALVCSPALRCRQTAAAFLDVFRDLHPIEDMQLYAGGTDAYLAQIVRYGTERSLMIVGHNPMIEALAHHLTRQSQMLAPIELGYPTAGLLAIAFPTPLPERLFRAGQAFQLITPSLT